MVLSRKERKRLRKLQEQQGGAEVAPLSPSDANAVRHDLVNEFEPVQATEARPNRAGAAAVSVSVRHWSGPLPAPEVLAAYNQVHPGFADRIVAQFEEQGRHRRRIENRVVWSNVVGSIGGQIMAFLILGGVVAGGVYLLLHDKQLGGFVTIALGAVGSIWAVVAANATKAQSLAQKRDQERKALQRR